MYLSCSYCGWSQGEYWDEHFNPLIKLEGWKDALLTGTSLEKHPSAGDPRTIRSLITEAMEASIATIRQMHYRTHDEYIHMNSDHTCPHCGHQALCEDEEYHVSELIVVDATRENARAWSKNIWISVNGQKKVAMAEHISYAQIVRLAGKKESPAFFTITYSHGPEANPEGSLMRDQTVEIAEGMSFCAVVTSQA